MTIRQLGGDLRSKRTSCVELVGRALARAKEHADLNAFITLTEEEARTEAAERDRELQAGRDRGPLHGIPIALKDLCCTSGIRTTGGSLLYKDFVPNYDADVVVRLRDAGAVSIGKTNLHELAFGITSLNPHFGQVRNPIDPKRIAGGSSGGSAAAVAAEIVPMAIGTDTGGSIRIPASYCGTVGLKPTYGVVSRRGVLPLAFTLDHVGPIGACVEDCALTMSAIADAKTGYDLPAPADLEAVRVGLPRNFFFEHVDEEVSAAVKTAVAVMQKAGGKVVEVDVPDFVAVNTTSHMIIMAEFASHHTAHVDREQFGADVWSLLEQGRMVAGHEYINAQRLRAVYCAHFNALWKDVDLLVTPTTPISAPLAAYDTIRLGDAEETVRAASTRLVRGLNLIGVPALSMPCGKARNGMPIGLQLVAPAGADARLLQLAKTLEGLLERQA